MTVPARSPRFFFEAWSNFLLCPQRRASVRTLVAGAAPPEEKGRRTRHTTPHHTQENHHVQPDERDRSVLALCHARRLGVRPRRRSQRPRGLRRQRRRRRRDPRHRRGLPGPARRPERPQPRDALLRSPPDQLGCRARCHLRPNAFPGDFFNFNAFPRARGIEFSTPGTGFQLSATAASGAGVEFDNVTQGLSELFGTFSPERLFAPLGSTVTHADFFIPGSDNEALTRGLGVVFTDVDVQGSAGIELFDFWGHSLGYWEAPAAEGDETLSFVGIAYDDSVVASATIYSGDLPIDSIGLENGGGDIVAMDDFIFGEPVNITECSPDCPADLTGDGILDLGDLTVFVIAFSSQDLAADLNADGLLDLPTVPDRVLHRGVDLAERAHAKEAGDGEPEHDQPFGPVPRAEEPAAGVDREPERAVAVDLLRRARAPPERRTRRTMTTTKTTASTRHGDRAARPHPVGPERAEAEPRPARDPVGGVGRRRVARSARGEARDDRRPRKPSPAPPRRPRAGSAGEGVGSRRARSR
jgi:hypothetical protein